MTLRVLGMAIATPLGDLDATIAAIVDGGSAAMREPTTGLAIAALDVTPSHARHARLVGRLPALAIDVARAAIADTLATAGERTGVFVATGGLRAHWDELAPAMAEQVQDGTRAWDRGLRRMHPLWMLRYLSNGAHALIATEIGATGDGATFGGPAAAASALIAASDAIASGAIDHAVVVALDDVTADEVAVELRARHPTIVPGAGVAAIVVESATDTVNLADTGTDPRRATIAAIDGVDPCNAEPSAGAIAAVRARLPPAAGDVTFAGATGWLGAAGPLVDAIVAMRFVATSWPARLDLGAPRSITVTAAASPGQIGIIRVEES